MNLEEKTMGLSSQNVVRVLNVLKEDADISQKSLCMIGKQDITFDWNDFLEIAERFGFKYNQDILSKIQYKYPIDSYDFFLMFGLKEVHAVDYSEYEGADIVFDLNDELPEELCGKFDYVIDGGTIEHVFDVAKALKNVSAMVKTGGTVIHISPLVNFINHGFHSMSPIFFEEYYTLNGFDVKRLEIEIVMLKDEGNHVDNKSVYSMDCRLLAKDVELSNFISGSVCRPMGQTCAYCWCIAKKCKQGGFRGYPIQGFWEKKYSAYSSEGKKPINEILREAVKFFKAEQGRTIALYGTGQVANLLINELHKNNLENKVSAIFVSNPSKAGSQYRGYKVLCPTKEKCNSFDRILIANLQAENEIYNFLMELDIEKEKIIRISDSSENYV